jgi:hypothetical protein
MITKNALKKMYTIYDKKRGRYGDIRVCDNDLDAYKDYYLNNLKYIRENPTEKFDDNILVYLGECDVSNYKTPLFPENEGIHITREMIERRQIEVLRSIGLKEE